MLFRIGNEEMRQINEEAIRGESLQVRSWVNVFTYILILLNYAKLMEPSTFISELNFHFPHVMYFALYVLYFAWPHFIEEIIPFFKHCALHFKKVLLAIAGLLVAVHFFTYEQFNLEMDERHLIHYVWLFLNENYYFKYLLTPVYYFVFYCMIKKIYFPFDCGFALVYIPALVLYLIFQSDIDVRNFFIPYILFRLRFQETQIDALTAEVMYGLFLNGLFFYAFGRTTVSSSGLYKTSQAITW